MSTDLYLQNPMLYDDTADVNNNRRMQSTHNSNCKYKIKKGKYQIQQRMNNRNSQNSSHIGRQFVTQVSEKPFYSKEGSKSWGVQVKSRQGL